MLYEKYLNVIDEKKDLFCSVLDKIWDNPENIFKEYAVVFAIKTYIEETMRKIYALCRESSSSKGN